MPRKLIGLVAAAVLVMAGCAQPETTTDNEVAPAAQEPATAPRPESQPAPKPVSRPAPPKPRPMVTIAEGTPLEVELMTSLNSGSSQFGDPFSVELIEPVRTGSGIVIPAGSMVHGTVQEVKKAKRGAGQASMTLSFSEIELPGGFITEVTASLSEQSRSKKKRNAAVIGGSAAGGALLGRVIGKDTKGAVVGAIVGGAIGTGVVLSKEGEQVDLPEGTPMTIQLDEPLKVPAPA